MNDQHSDLLDRARGLASAKALIEREIAALVGEARDSTVDISALARVLRVHRSTLYRQNEGFYDRREATTSVVTEPATSTEARGATASKAADEGPM